MLSWVAYFGPCTLQELNEISQLRWPLNRRTPNSKWLSARTSLIPEGENPNTWVYPFGTVLDIVLQNFPAGNGVVGLQLSSGSDGVHVCG